MRTRPGGDARAFANHVGVVAEPRVRDYRPAAELRAALRRFAHSTDETVRRHGLTPRRYELLLFVQAAWDEGRPATVTALCHPLQTVQGNVTQLVEGALDAGLLRRTPDPRDGRAQHLTLTPLGTLKLAAAHAELGEERERLARIVGLHFHH